MVQSYPVTSRNRAVPEPGTVAHIELVGDSSGAVGDPDRVRQVVRNLLSNATRYGGDTVRVRVCDAATTANLVVSDNGNPIPDEGRKRIFQPCQRAPNAPGPSESLGLGLAISRQLAHLIGGDPTYVHDGEESIFELSLPRKT